MDWTVLALCGIAVLLGALVQGVIGLGLALVASPVVTVVDPSLVPGTLLMCSLVMPLLTLLKERHDIDFRGLAWAFPFRFLGTGIGAWLVVVLSVTALSVGIGIFVLGAVALSLARWRPHPSPRALAVGAFVSGISGTATSIGGPPMALVYQHQKPSMLRNTLALYLVVGSIVSLATLAAVGKLTGHQLAMGGALVPFVVIGFWLSLIARRRISAERVRTGVLVVAAGSALVLIGKALAG